eukprot:CAMPEP_0179446522 /NCGR_PEP_ID=MMETSP0799-20121207/29960_1 /TAXON_ID=46947 /ORGANISM="Geminigera cryophila, Strain CCMP2564" /LENGTH=145 /DNA_ID=CAMNT_0021235633 /DNA_START=64 /DNA_END=501 /DNA_ORIENTATION=-
MAGMLNCCSAAAVDPDCCSKRMPSVTGPGKQGTPVIRATGGSGAPRSPTSGVGIVWRVARAQGVPNDILVVDAFDPNSSAAEADLRQGDILLRVDGVDVIGMPVPTVAEKIFGPVGSPVTLTLLRGGMNGQVVIVELQRRETSVK